MGKGIPTESRATQGETGWKRQLHSPSSHAKPVLPASLLYPKQLLSSMQGGEKIPVPFSLNSPLSFFFPPPSLNTCTQLLLTVGEEQHLLLMKGWNIEYCISSYSQSLKYKVTH